jgi:light-harvesting complex II chlorophyll a/b binding protein 4|tara:strand:- start:144 stop:278 length:135 start_codon:yes stop_codon:yes gene_type:complete
MHNLPAGRAAMMGITGFAVQECVWGTPVVDQTPFFFLPFGGFTG